MVDIAVGFVVTNKANAFAVDARDGIFEYVKAFQREVADADARFYKLLLEQYVLPCTLGCGNRCRYRVWSERVQILAARIFTYPLSPFDTTATASALRAHNSLLASLLETILSQPDQVLISDDRRD
jgi:hypothetical protein